MNKWIKIIIQNMGSNLTEGALQRAVRCVAPLQDICEQFDHESGVPVTASAHSTLPDEADVRKVVSVVLNQKLITNKGLRAHNSFPNIPLNPLHKWD